MLDDTSATTTTSDSFIGGNCIASSKFPLLYKWMTAMYTLPAVQETMFDLQSHARFGRSQLSADPEYDMGLEGEPPLPTSARL